MSYKGSGKKAIIQSSTKGSGNSRATWNADKPANSSKKDYGRALKKQDNKNHGTNMR